MRHDLMDILACPMCKSPLTLTVEKEEEEEIITGTLQCSECKEVYPILEAVPNLLPPSLRQT